MKKILILVYITMGGLCLFAQEQDVQEENLDQVEVQYADIPLGFNGVELGNSIEEVKNVLREERMFLYKEKVFSSLSKDDFRIIRVEGAGFLDNAYLYFSEDSTLVSLVLFLNTDYISYATMYENLEGKYGRPQIKLNQAKWTDGTKTMMLEKPLSVKYILEDAIAQPPLEERPLLLDTSRDEFMGLF